MSKYIEIAREISKRITSKRYPADSYLPSENELCEEFGASRDTVRKALNLLAERKRILKEKKGSRVLPVDIVTFPTSGLVSFKELAAHSSQEIETDVIQFGLTDDPVILEKLSMPEGSKAVQIIRIRTYDKERIIDGIISIRESFQVLPRKLHKTPCTNISSRRFGFRSDLRARKLP